MAWLNNARKLSWLCLLIFGDVHADIYDLKNQQLENLVLRNPRSIHQHKPCSSKFVINV